MDGQEVELDLESPAQLQPGVGVDRHALQDRWGVGGDVAAFVFAQAAPAPVQQFQIVGEDKRAVPLACLLLGSAGRAWNYTANDLAGNATTADLDVKIDRTPPLVQAPLSPPAAMESRGPVK